MGDSTIGTNIVTDGSTEYELLKAFLEKLERLFEDRKQDKYAENIKKLAEHLHHGKLEYKLVKNKYVSDFEQALDDAKIPYILLPNEDGETAIAIRDIDRDAFLEIQQRIFAKSTDYWKELSAQDFINTLDGDVRLRRSKVPVLSFEDNEMRLIAAQKLYDNNVVTSYIDGKMAVAPDSIYAKGGDLVDVQLDMAFEQAKGDGIKGYDLLTVRKEQAKYDQETLTEFCQAFKAGKQMSLWDASGHSRTGLTINRFGDIELCTPKLGYESRFAGEESIQRTVIVKHDDDISETALFSMLSKDAGQIYNMICCTNDVREDILKGNVVNCNRAKYARGSEEWAIYQDMRLDLQNALDEVKAKASQKVEEEYGSGKLGKTAKKFQSKEAKANHKEEIIIEILKTRDHPALQAWLSTPVIVNSKDPDMADRTLLTRKEKNELLDKIIEHFAYNHELSKDEMQVDYLKVSELKDLFKDAGRSNEKTTDYQKDDYDQDKE